MSTLTGQVIGVRGWMAEVAFGSQVPARFELLQLEGAEKALLEVYSSSGEGKVYCLVIRGLAHLYRGARVIATGGPIHFPTHDRLLGRVVNFLGEPLDGKENISMKDQSPIHRNDIYVAEILVEKKRLETGIKVIDLFCPLGWGCTVGIYGGAGVGKTLLLSEILANIVKKDKQAVGVFAGIGERSREALELIDLLQDEKLLERMSLIMGFMGENPAVRFRTGFSAVTLAEYFRDIKKANVLFFVDNLFRFMQAGNELSVMAGLLPSEDGYQPTLESELAHFHERLVSTKSAGITSIEAIYVPADDLLDHAVQSMLPYLDASVVLSRDIYQQGLLPAVDILKTSSTWLTENVVGTEHFRLALEAKATLAATEELERIVSMVGESELSETDLLTYRRGRKIKYFMTQPFLVSKLINEGDMVYVPLKETLRGVQEILSGKLDHVDEDKLLMIGKLPEISTIS